MSLLHFSFTILSSMVLSVRARAVTRGVNKVVKEDLKMALERQVSRSHENVVTVLRTFLVDEAELLQQNLAWRHDDDDDDDAVFQSFHLVQERPWHTKVTALIRWNAAVSTVCRTKTEMNSQCVRDLTPNYNKRCTYYSFLVVVSLVWLRCMLLSM